MSAAPTPTFTVGQTVILTRPYGRNLVEETTVVKVGRTLVHVTDTYAPGRTRAFYADSGAERRSANVGGHGHTIQTVEQRDEQERRRKIKVRLDREHHITPAGLGDFQQDTDTLQAVLDLLDTRKDQP